jgi:hypothetical protein
MQEESGKSHQQTYQGGVSLHLQDGQREAGRAATEGNVRKREEKVKKKKKKKKKVTPSSKKRRSQY